MFALFGTACTNFGPYCSFCENTIVFSVWQLGCYCQKLFKHQKTLVVFVKMCSFSMLPMISLEDHYKPNKKPASWRDSWRFKQNYPLLVMRRMFSWWLNVASLYWNQECCQFCRHWFVLPKWIASWEHEK